jgi:carbonic anhydrase
MNISNIKELFKQLPTNIFAGFVVSLVAMPLGLGLALASGAPPISGIVAAVVGGTLVSILGGGHVSITGPGNGLVVVVLSTITALGAGNAALGFSYTLAAIICSGALILILAFVNLGKLSGFFPNTAIQGMLAAIGIIILSKQAHIMLGNMHATGSTFQLLFSIPGSLVEGLKHPLKQPAAISGLISLSIMVFYPRIRNKYFQLIPAPMWIVIFAVGLAYFIEYNEGLEHPIHKSYFVSIPDDVFSHFPRPDFGKMFTSKFILSTLSITLIASIESLLSIKAVDKLDPRKRKTNVKRDLKALGLATMVSGFLGGLNVVTVIARSSVNVNNKATNRFSNFFQAVFLVLFILLFSKQIMHIPFPALAAILVFTGYKLASPDSIRHISKVGKEQLIIFFVTLLATLGVGIVFGFLIGIVTTFLVHFFYAKSVSLFTKYAFANNLSLTKGKNGDLKIKVYHFSSFINFYRIKNILDRFDNSKTVMLDFLSCRFIDHTVMENLLEYEQQFDKSNGRLKLIGLELHHAETSHPSAFRRIIGFVTHSSTRQQELTDYFKILDWHYSPEKEYHMYFLNHFTYFRTLQPDSIQNIAADNTDLIKFFDLNYKEGAFIAEEFLHASMVYIKCPKPVPKFSLSKRDIYERLNILEDLKEIKIKHFKDFATLFSLKGKNVFQIRRFFTDELILFLESNPYYHLESDGIGGLLIFDKEHLDNISEVKSMVDFSIRLSKFIEQ